MSRRLDLAGAAILLLATAALLFAFFTEPAFFDWAFMRHQNPASWMARPLLLLPLCLFAWWRSATGIMASILALLTSMFWFPVPETVRPDIAQFLDMERELLSQGWSTENAIGVVVVLLYLAALLAAFWQRSWRLGATVVIAGAAGKMAWSVIFSPEAGDAVIPFALGGLGVFAMAILLWRCVSRQGDGRR